MSLLNEYIDKKLSVSEYNNIRETYLLIYAAAIEKPIPGVQLQQGDFYVIHDLLRSKNKWF